MKKIIAILISFIVSHIIHAQYLIPINTEVLQKEITKRQKELIDVYLKNLIIKNQDKIDSSTYECLFASVEYLTSTKNFNNYKHLKALTEALIADTNLRKILNQYVEIVKLKKEVDTIDKSTRVIKFGNIKNELISNDKIDNTIRINRKNLSSLKTKIDSLSKISPVNSNNFFQITSNLRSDSIAISNKLDSLSNFNKPFPDSSISYIIDSIINKYPNSIVSFYFKTLKDNIKIKNNKIDTIYSLNILNALYDKYSDKAFSIVISDISKHSLGVETFFNLGVNYYSSHQWNQENGEFKITGNESGAFLSEKIGFKVKFNDLKYSRSFRKNEWFLYKGTYRKWYFDQPISYLSDIGLIVYGSGLIFQIENLNKKSLQNIYLGIGLNLNFSNRLNLNACINFPITNQGNSYNPVYSLGFDIPIGDYLKLLGK